jgi:hypothetical protein
LHRGQSERLHPPDPLADQDDVEAVEGRRDQHQAVAWGQGEAALGAQEEEPDRCQQGSHPRVPPRPLTPEEGQEQGDQDDVEAGDEAGLAGGGEGQPGLLESGAGEEDKPRQRAPADLPPGEAPQTAPRHGQDEQSAQQEAEAVEEERPQGGSGDFAGDEGASPGQRRSQQHQVGAKRISHIANRVSRIANR